ncbi:hypothetical protein [Chengkuizengella sediminis]|uniref:hypothetical protein n=1 Tax=Chengkuizengella sediminis TaxID=1885917 RepID=UPI0013894874|nr:hypothetical protein [Chengkuizengella sediminis]NDI33688.1 hypothetical protein [Chengkuizengella sediminis]
MSFKTMERMKRVTLKHLEDIQKNLNRTRHQQDKSRSNYDMDLMIKQVLYQRKSPIKNTIDQFEKRISKANDISSVEQLVHMKKELKKLLISLEEKM